MSLKCASSICPGLNPTGCKLYQRPALPECTHWSLFGNAYLIFSVTCKCLKRLMVLMISCWNDSNELRTSTGRNLPYPSASVFWNSTHYLEEISKIRMFSAFLHKHEGNKCLMIKSSVCKFVSSAMFLDSSVHIFAHQYLEKSKWNLKRAWKCVCGIQQVMWSHLDVGCTRCPIVKWEANVKGDCIILPEYGFNEMRFPSSDGLMAILYLWPTNGSVWSALFMVTALVGSSAFQLIINMKLRTISKA